MYFFTLVALSAATVNAAAALTDQQKCQKKNQNAVKAIQQLCAPTNMVVPSTYALEGKLVGNGGTHETWVNIYSNCNPAMWVPQKYCLSQFYELCANGQDGGNAQGYYGKNNCQEFVIQVGENVGGSGANKVS